MESWLQDIAKLYQTNQLDLALKKCSLAQEQHKDNADLLQLHGLICAKLGNMQAAIHAFSQAIKLVPDNAIYHNNLSTAYKHIGQLDLASQHLHEAVRIAPNNAETYNNLGALQYSQGQITAAIPLFEKAIRLNPNNWEAHYNLANSLIKSELVMQAISHYQAVLRLDPNHANANVNLAMAYVSLKDYTSALPYLQRAAAANPQHAELQGHLAEAYLDLGNHAAAIDQFCNALKLEPTRAEWHHNLAVLYLRTKQNDQAKQHFEQSLLLQPDNPTASHMLQALGATNKQDTADTPPSAYVADLFDQYASYYNKHMREDLKYNVPLLLRHAVNKFFSASSKTINVLDLGCGTGLCGIYFRDLANFLVGVDLSAQMLAQAKSLGAYDGLCRCNIMQVIPGYGRPVFDLVLAADVLGYMGNLTAIFSAVAGTLRAEGKFAFTIEHLKHEADFQLQTSGRFAHHDNYIQKLARENGLDIIINDDIVLREQENVPVTGRLYIAQVKAI